MNDSLGFIGKVNMISFLRYGVSSLMQVFKIIRRKLTLSPNFKFYYSRKRNN